MGDFPQVVALCARARERIKTYPNCPLDERSVQRTFGRCVASPAALALVSEHDGKLTGLLLAITQELWWSVAKEATDAILYAERPGDGLRMGRRYVEWAWTRPRVEVLTLAYSAGEDIPGAQRFHERLGLKTIGCISQGVRPSEEA